MKERAVMLVIILCLTPVLLWGIISVGKSVINRTDAKTVAEQEDNNKKYYSIIQKCEPELYALNYKEISPKAKLPAMNNIIKNIKYADSKMNVSYLKYSIEDKNINGYIERLRNESIEYQLSRKINKSIIQQIDRLLQDNEIVDQDVLAELDLLREECKFNISLWDIYN